MRVYISEARLELRTLRKHPHQEIGGSTGIAEDEDTPRIRRGGAGGGEGGTLDSCKQRGVGGRRYHHLEAPLSLLIMIAVPQVQVSAQSLGLGSHWKVQLRPWCWWLAGTPAAV